MRSAKTSPPPAGELHIWRARLDTANARDGEALLSEDELERARRMRFDRDRDRLIAARATLRELLARYLVIAPAEVAFVTGPRGKPQLAQGATDLRFNLSHSGDLAVYALATGRDVGVDVERLGPRRDLPRLTEHAFGSRARHELEQLPEAERLPWFHARWTAKEAALKCSGEGLSADAGQGEPCRIWPLDLDPGYAGAVAASGTADARVVAFDWPS